MFRVIFKNFAKNMQLKQKKRLSLIISTLKIFIRRILKLSKSPLNLENLQKNWGSLSTMKFQFP